jgi:hypothetical protein
MNDEINIKPGWKTTEFWLTLGTFIVTGSILTGMLAPERKDTLINIISHSVESIAMVAGQTIMLLKYITSRQEAKKVLTKQPTSTRRKKTKTTGQKSL